MRKEDFDEERICLPPLLYQILETSLTFVGKKDRFENVEQLEFKMEYIHVCTYTRIYVSMEHVNARTCTYIDFVKRY